MNTDEGDDPPLSHEADGSELPLGFREDLKTQWIPDAVGGWGTTEILAGQTRPSSYEKWAEQLIVPYGQGTRSVPVISTEWQAELHALVDRRLVPLERELCPEVYGYRGPASPYREDYRNFRDSLKRFGTKYALVLKTDVAGMFESATSDRLHSFGVIPKDLTLALREVEHVAGLALLPGHRWARRVANVFLVGVDKIVDQPFCRWQDDYFVFGNSVDELEDALGVMGDAARSVGLSLNSSKSRIGDARELTRERVSDYPTDPKDLLLMLESSLESDGHVSEVRYCLRQLLDRRVKIPQSWISLLGRYSHFLPRLAWYLSSFSHDEYYVEASRRLFLVSSSDWQLSRLLPLMYYVGLPSTFVAGTGIEKWAVEHQLPAIRDLAHKVGLPVDPFRVSDRVRRMGNAIGPMMETTL